MTLMIELEPGVEARLLEAAGKQGLDAVEYVRQLIQREVPLRSLTARELLALPVEQRASYLAAAAEDAASHYERDLARPPAERELTAMTALDGEPFHDGHA